MSRRALAQAVVDRLRSATASGGVGLSANECDFAPINGMPPPRCGERFVGVWDGPRSNRTPGSGIDETYSINVTVTMRTNKVPFDRLGKNLVYADGGLNDLVDEIRLSLQRDRTHHVVINAANIIISAGTPSETTPRGFEEGLAFEGDTSARPVGGSWFQSDKGEPLAGLVADLKFGRARRVQSFTAPSHEET